MSALSGALLIPLTLAMARTLPMVALAPFGALGRLPSGVRPAVALLLAAAGAGTGTVAMPAGAHLYWAYASNLLLGWLAALVAFFAAEAFPVIGGVLDASYGWAFVQSLNPEEQPTSLMASLFSLLMPTLFLEAGGLAWLVAVIWHSYQTWPLARVLAPTPYWFSGLGQFAAAGIMAGIGVALPFVLMSLILSLITGVIGRVLPQLQVLSIQFPVLMAMGMAMLLVALPTLPDLVGTLLTSAEQAMNGLGHAAWGGG
jgi:flagellar biosynthetic protein FliR